MKRRKTWAHHRLYGWRRKRRIAGLLHELAHIEHVAHGLAPEKEWIHAKLARMNVSLGEVLRVEDLGPGARLKKKGQRGLETREMGTV